MSGSIGIIEDLPGISPYPRYRQRKQEEVEFQTKIPYVIEKEDIPQDPQEFYEDFGYLEHQRTGEVVKHLTDYQYDIWKCPAKSVLVAKSQKTGITTSELLHDFQEMITIGRGKDMLMVAQTAKIAQDHLYTLKRMLIDSDKYRKYLITKSKELYFAEEKTKIGTVFLKNADNPFRPMRIMALPFRKESIWSWKQIIREHVSDPAVATVVDDESVYSALTSRLTNTDGRMMIEGPPVGPYGFFYRLHEQYKDNANARFQVFNVTVYDAREEGLVTQDQIDQYRQQLGPKFPITYEASFVEGVGNVFDPKLIDHAVKLGEHFADLPVNPYAVHLGGCDPGFGKITPAYVGEIHKFYNSILKRDSWVLRIVEFKQWDDKATPRQVALGLHDMYKKVGTNLWWFLDGSDRGFVNECKGVFGESHNWDEKKGINRDENRIIPINFRGNHTQMLFKVYNLLAKGKLAIERKYMRLILSMRTAVADKFDLDKDRTLNDDDLDDLRLLCSSVKP